MKVVTILAALFALFLAIRAQASTVISGDWDFNSANLAATDVAGVVPVNHWNVITTGGSQTNLKDNTGTVTTAGFTTSNLFGPSGGTVNSNFPAGPNNNMMTDTIFTNFANKDPQAFVTYLSFSQIPYAGYDLYIYTSADVTGRTATFQIGSDQEIKGTGNPSTFVRGANYVLFTGLTASSFSIQARANSDTAFSQIVFNGFQIVSPEPASLGMLLMGGTVLLRRRRA